MASVALRMASSRPAAAARRRGTAFFSEFIRGLPIFNRSIRTYLGMTASGYPIARLDIARGGGGPKRDFL